MSLPAALEKMLAEPDSILPHQTVATPSEAGPERRLACAVLEQAHQDVAYARRGQQQLGRKRVLPTTALRETLAWFGSNDRAWPYSFLNLADLLGLDAQVVRRRVGVA